MTGRGRKRKAVRFDGDKRHAATFPGGAVALVAAVTITAANRPEGEAAYDLFANLEGQRLLATLDVDRACLHATPVQWRHALGLHVNCCALRAHNGELFDETRFEARICNACPQKPQCTTSARARAATRSLRTPHSASA